MRAVAHRSLTAVLLVVAAGLAAIGIAGVVAAWSGWGDFLGSYSYPELVLGLSWTPVGLVLATRRPRNPVGWVVLLFGMQMLGDRAATALGEELVGPPGMAVAFVGTLQLVPFPPFTVLPALALVLFPDGRPPSRNWWWGLVPLLVLATIASAGTRWAPGTELFSDTMWSGTEAAGGLLLLAAVVGLVGRRRRADPVLRQQVRGVLFAMGLAVAVVAVFVLLERPWLGNPALALVPVSIGAAVVRYRLFDLDRLISRTVAYAVVVALLAGTYLALVMGLGTLTRAMTGESGELVVALSTLAVAALFQPVRRPVQRLVDRHFDRATYDAVEIVDRFSRGLRDEVDLEAVVDGLCVTTVDAMRPSTVGVHLLGPATQSRELP